ncbi:MAG: tRNA (N6-isopentenyl adenosine(37)-C2)-methylthiotransferase MiaB [Rickettsiales bacterium]|nr:tRNA (N6-isopentenyl adenosine(37)-C2)-methylthiotransferase MiaB [Rickettsiales bacterium]
MSKKLYIKTYGCQMNVYDTERMEDILEPLGYEVQDTAEDADLVILNTCHIREKAEEKVYSDLGRIKKKRGDKQSIIAVGGCVGQAAGEQIMKRAPYVDMVFGPQTYQKLPAMLRELETKKGVVELDFPTMQKFDELPQPGKPKAGSAFLSVQEGCDKFCTFCVVPYTRGGEYSRPVEKILEEAKILAAKGTIEVTLLGQNVNAYHGLDKHSNERGLAWLIREIANDVPEIKRIRYTTSHPRDMEDDLIAAHGDLPQMMPYLHLPVQAGSDRILKAMNRQHTAASYIEIIDKLRTVRSDIALSGDFIVGFPGETDEDFKDTMRLIETVGYAQSYSFKYSPRPGTPAAEKEQVPEPEKVKRLALLQGLLSRQHEAFNRSSDGKTFEVLFDRVGKKEGQLIGKSPYQQSVHVTDAQSMGYKVGDLCKVEIVEAQPNSLAGRIVETPSLRANAVSAAI